MDFKFNAWGGDSTGAMISYANDDLAARKMLQATGHDRSKTTFVLEGGSIIADGEGHGDYHRELPAEPEPQPRPDKAAN